MTNLMPNAAGPGGPNQKTVRQVSPMPPVLSATSGSDDKISGTAPAAPPAPGASALTERADAADAADGENEDGGSAASPDGRGDSNNTRRSGISDHSKQSSGMSNTDNSDTTDHSGHTDSGSGSGLGGVLPAALAEPIAAVKPKLRGWFHAGTFPLALVAGIVLICLARTPGAAVACSIFAVSSWLLFGVSGIYHRGSWGPKWRAVLRRLDHTNIFLIIAGTYTPLSVILLPHRQAALLLSLVWAGALIGIGMRVLWLGAPRWVYVPCYLALGWAAVFFLPEFLRYGGPVVLALVIAGGLLYSLGAVVYGLKRPDPAPRWFGFHEIFHLFTIAAFVCHYIAISITAYSHAHA